MSYKVTAPLVLAKDQDGHTHHRYEGAVIHWLNDEQAEHLVAEGMVEEVDGGEDVEEAGPPAKSAPKQDWVDYAVDVHGADADEAGELTKQELIDEYGE